MTALRARVAVRRWDGVDGRLIGSDPYERETLATYRAGGGYAQSDGAALVRQARAVGLRGRGGAGFPTWRKLAAVRDASSRERVVVANGEEGEPTSLKDRYLLRMRPHLVLDGLRLAAQAVGASSSHVYVSDGRAASSVRAALDERPPEALATRVVLVPHSYVAGEETAAVRWIDGGPAAPMAKPPRPFERGVGGEPTLVANVESLASLALLASHGVAAYRRHGTDGCEGTFLATLSTPGRTPLLCEVPYGVQLGALLDWAGIQEVGGFLMGGFFGGLLSPDAVTVRLSSEALRARGSGLGCGAIVALEQAACPISAAADSVGYLAAESSQQCGSCIRGTAAMSELLSRLEAGRADSEATQRLEGLSQRLQGRGACGLLDAAAALTQTLFREFPVAVSHHLAQTCLKDHPTLRGSATGSPGGWTRYALNSFDPEEE